MYLIAALPLITVLPAAWRWLPESVEEQSVAASREERRDAARAGLRAIFAPGIRTTTVMFWVMSFCSLLFVYGANTWLPTLMQDDGRGFSSSLNFLLCFNLGAIVGGIVGPSVTGWIVSATSGGTAAFLLFAAVGVVGALVAGAVRHAAR